ncbi:YlxR family protein [Okeania sp. KiyG1]|uniref:YlxR family protein n=1 Tax=Okeania sp. KiyG1 TaxID=2720165 RepID=UPI001920F8B2|nr:YlxR family protein [Okeania sp. KiyG1]
MKPNYRRCVSCKKLAPKEDFLRIVRLKKSSTIRLDRGEGRSAYICPEIECLQIARKKNKLGRSLKTYVSPEIYQELWQRLKKSSSKNTKDDD